MFNTNTNTNANIEIIDLNVNNYSINDLECFFRFSSKQKYTPSDIELRENEIRNILLNSGHVSKKIKRDFIFFLENAKKRLINEKCTPPPQPTTIPKNYILDNTPNLPASSISISREEELCNFTKNQSNQNTNQMQNQMQNQTQNNSISKGTSLLHNQILGTFPNLQENGICNKKTSTVNLCIDSIFRKNYLTTQSSDYIYHVPKLLTNVISLRLSSIELPRISNTFNCNKNNNSMEIIIFKNEIKTIHRIEIPENIYTVELFSLTINNIFKSKENEIKYLYCEIDPINFSTIIRIINLNNNDNIHCNNEHFSFLIEFNIENNIHHPLYKNLGWMMGFRKKKYFIHSKEHNTYLKSEAFFGNSCDNYIFLEIDDYNNNFPTDTIISSIGYDGNYIGKNIIAKIIIDTDTKINNIFCLKNDGRDLIYKEREYFGPVNIEKLKIRILNRFGEVVNFNQNDFSMTLEIKQLQNP